MIKPCKYCKDPYNGPTNSWACSKPECQNARYRDWKRKKYGPPKIEAPRTCIHCRELFIIQNHRANRRAFCYKPECVKKNKQWSYVKAKIKTAEWREKPKAKSTGELCQVCKRPLPEDGSRHFRHDTCAERVNSRIDGDYIYNFDIGILEV
jgi:hypothetical protein